MSIRTDRTSLSLDFQSYKPTHAEKLVRDFDDPMVAKEVVDNRLPTIRATRAMAPGRWSFSAELSLARINDLMHLRSPFATLPKLVQLQLEAFAADFDVAKTASGPPKLIKMGERYVIESPRIDGSTLQQLIDPESSTQLTRFRPAPNGDAHEPKR